MGMAVFIFVITAPLAEIINIKGIASFFHVPSNLERLAVLVAVSRTGG